MRDKLVATFNSAFKLSDSGGGFVSGGHVYAPMKPGEATIVRYRDGHVNIDRLARRRSRRTGIMYARQNLPLIVNGGRLNSNLSNGPEWGATLGNAVRVWRSGVGIDSHGNLIYAAADIQTVASLAEILQARRRRPRDGARHQRLLAQLHHLSSSGSDRGREPARQHGPLATALPDSG